jgi:hypothetical protein
MKKLICIVSSLVLVLGITCFPAWSSDTVGVDCTDNSIILAGGGYGPGNGTGNDGDGPEDGTGNGPGDCSESLRAGNSVILAHGDGGHGPGDGDGNDGEGPQDGTGYGPGEC